VKSKVVAHPDRIDIDAPESTSVPVQESDAIAPRIGVGPSLPVEQATTGFAADGRDAFIVARTGDIDAGNDSRMCASRVNRSIPDSLEAGQRNQGIFACSGN
jgi:hypothetical protein